MPCPAAEPKVPEFPVISDADLAQTRLDRAFRQHILTGQLHALIAAMAVLKGTPEAAEPPLAGQLREGADLAVKLADILKRLATSAKEPAQSRLRPSQSA